jgi:hypothetical protein
VEVIDDGRLVRSHILDVQVGVRGLDVEHFVAPRHR